MSISPDNYIGEPRYPSPWATKQPLEGLRDLNEAKIVSLAPDVCLTPVGSSVAPIPYPVVDFCGHHKSFTNSVRFTHKKAMVMRSRTTHVHGDKAGVRKGVKSGTVGDVCEPIGHAALVRAEGSQIIRHLDRFWMNNRNTQGEAVFVRDMSTEDAPKDDDPVPGSLRWKGGQVMSDASPEPLIMGAQYAQAVPNAQPLPYQPSSPSPVQSPPRGPAKILTPNAEQARRWKPPKLPVKPPSAAARALPWLGRIGKFGIRRLPVIAFLYPDSLGAPISELLGGDLFPRADEEWEIVREAEQAVKAGDISQEDAIEHSRRAIREYREFLDAEHERVRQEVENHPKLGTALKHNVRVDTEDKRRWPCVVGPYKYVKMICPGEAHHIIPDMVYRIGKAPANEAEKDSTTGRIPNSPTYNQGQAICLSPAMHRTDDDAVHKSLNPALADLGKQYNPQGTAPLGKILEKTHQAIDRITDLPPKCKRMAKLAADAQVNVKFRQPGRTTIQPPRLPGGQNVVDVLKAGKY